MDSPNHTLSGYLSSTGEIYVLCIAESSITGKAEAYFNAFIKCCVRVPLDLLNSIKHCRNRITYGKLINIFHPRRHTLSPMVWQVSPHKPDQVSLWLKLLLKTYIP